MTTAICRPYPKNAPLGEMRTAELFTVTSLRLWAEAYRDPVNAGSDPSLTPWRQGFQAADISADGTTAFNALFLVVASAAIRPLDVRCPKCPSLGEDEAWFLQLIGLLQRDCATGAELVLMNWLPPAAVRTAMPFAAILAAALADGGLTIPKRPDEDARRHRFDIPRGAIQYGGDTLALIH